ncbi:BclA C-terminal domain-containing protein [Desulforamulus ferrireducens]|uniref:BclA C-terminal domain-containing protein n=1 Tax=Desulforamulus ferrireducens TaxID=1833852 RepID=UPI003082D18B
MAAFGSATQLATLADQTILAGADIPFSDNGPLFNIAHTAGTTTFTVTNAGTYQIDYIVNITAGLNASIVLTVGGVEVPGSQVDALVATGQLTGSVILTLAAGDVITLRNNSVISLTMPLAPSTGAQITIIQLD